MEPACEVKVELCMLVIGDKNGWLFCKTTYFLQRSVATKTFLSRGSLIED